MRIQVRFYLEVITGSALTCLWAPRRLAGGFAAQEGRARGAGLQAGAAVMLHTAPLGGLGPRKGILGRCHVRVHELILHPHRHHPHSTHVSGAWARGEVLWELDSGMAPCFPQSYQAFERSRTVRGHGQGQCHRRMLRIQATNSSLVSNHLFRPPPPPPKLAFLLKKHFILLVCHLLPKEF